MEHGRGDGGPARPFRLDDATGRSAGRDVRRLPQLVAQAFGLVRRAAPRQLSLAASLQILAALSLAAQLLVVRRVLDGAFVDGATPDLGALAPDLIAFGVLLVVVAIANVAQKEQQRTLGELVQKHTTGRVLDVATSVDLIDFDRPGFYDELQRARLNAGSRPLQIANGVLGLIGSGAAVAAVGSALLLLEPLVAVIIVLGGVPSLVVNRIASRQLHAYMVEQTPGDRRRDYLYNILSRKEEAQEIRAFTSSPFLRAEHDRLFDERIGATRALVRRRTLYGAISGFLGALVTVGAVALLVYFVRTGRTSTSDAAVAIGAVIIVAGRVRTLVSSGGSLYEGALFLTDFTRFVETHPTSPPTPTTGGAITPFERLELDRVSFTYPSRSLPSLDAVSLTLRRGEVIALVGENGSGKTTLTKLLAGLYRPTDGVLRWDGTDTAGVPLQELREHTAVIFQDFSRYFLPVHHNVAISRIRDLDDGPGVRAAAARAGADRFVTDLPEGYDTLLGPSFAGGSDLSLGQWQRIALARAYFRDAPLLILDEPTASLDPRGEFEIFEQVRRLAEGHTVVLVSHRFSSVRAADRILVLEAGRIVEEGSHEELLALDGLYAELFNLQAAGYRDLS